MENNNKTTIWISIAVLLVLLIVGVLIIKATKNDVVEVNNTVEEDMYEKTVDVKHQYKDGKHIFAGTLEVPTPCHKVEATVIPGDVAVLNLEVKDSGGVCAQVITDANFYVEHMGPQELLFVGRLNGEPVNLNKFEIDADMDINAVDIFIKG